MGDSYLSGTNKQDQGGNSSERDPKRQASENSNHGFPGVQERQGQVKATNEGKNAASKNAATTRDASNSDASGSDKSSKSSALGESTDRKDQKQSLGASRGEQHIRSIDTPPGEPYNDPHVRH